MKLLRIFSCYSFQVPAPFSRFSTRLVRKSFSTTRILAIEMETVNTTERLRKLRNLMKEHKVDVYSMNNSRSSY